MGEGTEAPTPRRQAEMRRQGQVAKSPELSGALALLAGLYLLRSQGGAIVAQLSQLMRDTFNALSAQDLTPVLVRARGMELGLLFLRMTAPLILTIMAVGVLSMAVQTRGMISFDLIIPKLDRLNPLSAIKQMFSMRSLVETIKNVGKLAIVGWVVFQPLPQQMMAISAAATADVFGAISLLTSTIMDVSVRAALFFTGLAAMDYVYQWRQFRQNALMTLEEVQEERKSAEGSPMIKGRVRELQRRYALQRMMQQVPKADVVVTNPTHLAIALRYDGETMMSPTIVAKGKGIIAFQISKIAKQHRIPVVENRPLAHALIRLEIGAQITPDLYKAVAEVLAFVYRLRRARPAFI